MAKAIRAIPIDPPDGRAAAGDPASRRDRRRERARFFATEMTISLAFTLVMSAVSSWFLSDAAIASTGRFADALPDMMLSTTGPITGFVIPITLAVRARVRRGQVRPLAGPPVRPRNVLLRTALLCLVAPVVLGVPGAAVLAAAAPQGASFFLFKIAYGGIVSLAVTPFVLIAALRDR